MPTAEHRAWLVYLRTITGGGKVEAPRLRSFEPKDSLTIRIDRERLSDCKGEAPSVTQRDSMNIEGARLGGEEA